MTTAPPRRTPGQAPALKLYLGRVAARGVLAELLRVGSGIEVTVYLYARTKLAAIGMLGERFIVPAEGIDTTTGREVEVSTLRGPELGAAMARDAPDTAAEGRSYAVHGRRVVEVDADGRAFVTGIYRHEAKRYRALTAADRLAEHITVVEALARRGRAMNADDEVALQGVLTAARERLAALRAEDVREGVESAFSFEACLLDAADPAADV